MIIKTNDRTATCSLLIQQTLQIPSTLRDSPALYWWAWALSTAGTAQPIEKGKGL